MPTHSSLDGHSGLVALEVVSAILEDPPLPVAPPYALNEQGCLALHLAQVALHLGWDRGQTGHGCSQI